MALKRESFDSSGLVSTPPPGQAYAADYMYIVDFFLSNSYTSRIALFQLDAGSWLHGQHDGLNLFRGSKFHSWSVLGRVVHLVFACTALTKIVAHVKNPRFIFQ